jgi:hypothetical protein
MTPEELVGKSYTFDDNSTIKIVQIKQKDIDGEVVGMVTYHIEQGRSLPRKLVMPYNHFIERFGHLFES